MPIASDGTVTIKCYNCGEDIIRTAYPGFSTALCVKCQEAQKEMEKYIRKDTAVHVPLKKDRK